MIFQVRPGLYSLGGYLDDLSYLTRTSPRLNLGKSLRTFAKVQIRALRHPFLTDLLSYCTANYQRGTRDRVGAYSAIEATLFCGNT